MKKWIVLAALAITLTGCASTQLSEAEYVEVVNGTEGLERMTVENIRDLGGQICGVFDEAENPYVTTLATLTDGGMDSGPAGALIALSLSQYCPNHVSKIPDA